MNAARPAAFCLLCAAMAMLLSGCGGGGALPPDRVRLDEHASGDGQTDLHGTLLEKPFRVVVESAVQPGLFGGKGERRGIGGAKVQFEVEDARTGSVFEESGAQVAEIASDPGGFPCPTIRRSSRCACAPWAG